MARERTMLRWFSAVALSGLVLVAGCDGGEDAAPAAEAGAVATGEPFRVGVLLPASGVYAPLGESLTRGMELCFEQANWQAGGRRIELVKEDSEADPQVSLRKLRLLKDRENVDMVTGMVSSAVAYALRDELHNRKIPTLVINAGANDLTRGRRSPYIWRSSFSQWQIGHSMGEWAAQQGIKDVFVTAPDYAAGHEFVDDFRNAFQAAGGNVVGEVYPPLGTNDYGAYLTQIKQANPGAVYAFFAGSDAVRFVKQYEEYGLKGNIPLIGPGWLQAENIRPAMGTSPVGIRGALYWYPDVDNAENRTFVQAYRAQYNDTPSAEAAGGCDAAKVIMQVVENAGANATPDQIAQAFGNVQFTSPRGPFRFDPETHNVVQNIYVAETVEENGETVNRIISTIPAVQDPGA